MCALIQGGASVNFRDDKGRTPLLAAVSKCRGGAVEALLLSGARPELATQQNDWTVLCVGPRLSDVPCIA